VPRVAQAAFHIPLTALLLSADQDVTGVMETFAASLTRYMSAVFRNSEQPTEAEISSMLAWSRNTLREVFGKNGEDVDRLFDVGGTYPNIVKLHLIDAAGAGSEPIVARSIAELQALGIGVNESAIVRGLSNPLPILSSREWVDPNGRKLSTRIWKAGDDIYNQIDAITRYEFSRGVSPTRLADRLEEFLTTEGAKPRTNRLAGRTGRVGSYSARRLVRTELARAHGNAVMAAGHADPFTAGVRWNLGFAHPGLDACDGNASANGYSLGKGVYPIENVPTYPNHPHCLCYLSTIDVHDRERIRYGVSNNLIDTSGIDNDQIVEQVTGFLNAA
jgi:hypothetical protein